MTDIGLRNAFFGYNENNINAYLENIVFIELLHRGYDVKIGKYEDYEIDFIAQKTNERLYFQVCYILSDRNVWERETRPFFKITDNYPKYLLSMDLPPESNAEGIFRKYIPDWLMESY